ncbi:DUF1643 domain-containing protein [Clostridium sp. UBA6640]|uniref:DUF1643 domain-containing protein n=1 Tax=Clostridium sp. UBA6640 TaxID=1946370 RepID=UPI0025B848EC|nr:DUF1643 domain-containing protein [Clostridium sp. UBA6640]
MSISIKEHTATIETSEKYAEDELGNRYRYLLKRTWDKEKNIATVIMLNPSKADILKSDKTITSLMNYLIDNNYGSMIVVNMFSYMSTDPKELKNKKDEFEALNNKYIIEASEKADDIIIAWTRENFINKKREVEFIIKSYKNKLKCFRDNKGRVGRHPRDLGQGWELVDYNFKYI